MGLFSFDFAIAPPISWTPKLYDQITVQGNRGLYKGVLYIAGGEEFVEEAVASAGSLKRHNPTLQATLFADREVCVDRTGLDSTRVIDFSHQRAKVATSVHRLPYWVYDPIEPRQARLGE
jgi:hypothetical protein